MKKSENILLLGLGSIGFYLAKRLSLEGHNITAIERDPAIVQKAQGELDIRVIEGDATDFREWQTVEACNMDYVMAMTNDDSVNIIAALLADRFGIKQKIIRDRSMDIWSDDAVLKAKDLKIDCLIRPEELASQEILRLLKMRSGQVVVGVGDRGLQIVEIPVKRRSFINQMTIRDLAKKYDDLPFQIVSITRDIETFIPYGDFKIQFGDHVFVLIGSKDLPILLKLAELNSKSHNRILIIGGGMVGTRVAELLQDSFRVKLIEKDESRAEELSHHLQKTECLHGDGADSDTLLQAGLLHMDTVIAATSDNDTNIMTSVLAKHLILKYRPEVYDLERTIALVKREEYSMLAAALGTNFAVNKKILAANAVLRYMRRGHVLSVSHLQGCNAEVVEMLADPESKITTKKLAEFKLANQKIRIGAVYKNSDWVIASGEMQINSGDRVVCICEEDSLGPLQELFLS